jgi:hypothetical protein
MKKRCVRCAEQIEYWARGCRYCGADQPPPPEPSAWEKIVDSFGSDDKPRRSSGASSGCLPAIVGLCLFAFVLGMCDRKEPPAPVAAVRPANDPAKCQKVVDLAWKNGIIREQPDAQRINVDDYIWADTAASEKRTLLQIVACTAYGGRTPAQLSAGDYVVAYGYRSGKRLGMASKAGVTLE